MGRFDFESMSQDEDAVVKLQLNSTGNIFTASTSREATLSDETGRLFKGVSTLFDAMAKAMSESGRDLFDYDGWMTLLQGSGLFVQLERYDRNLEIRSCAVPVGTQIIQQALPGISDGASMDIAKRVLLAIGGKLEGSREDEKKRFGHLMFINEEIMGCASVSVRLFYASRESHAAVIALPCHKMSARGFYQKQIANNFLLVDAGKVSKYECGNDSAEGAYNYKGLVESMLTLLNK
ncbi:hypothetical protein [Pseudomonas sp. COR18]|uniref:hypothetical protein n=1 Tax=Pseudomonas sp. COR18 TaxID=3399680 RepID=UPI003AFFF22C